MQQSQHRSVQQAASYYNEAGRRLGQLYGLGFERAQQPAAELRFGLRRAGMG